VWDANRHGRRRLIPNVPFDTGSYTLVPGVFLFLGYSEKDELLLKSLDIMNFEIKDVIYAVQKYIQEHMVYNVSTLY